MPLFMDVHERVPDLTPEAVAQAHLRDLEVQGPHDVKYLQYWFDQAGGTIFCLVDAPDANAAATVHREAHGLVADHITPVQAAEPAAEDTLMRFVHKAVGDVAALLAGPMVVIGDRLGLYRAMADGEPVDSVELAHRTETDERYVREWLGAQAAAGYLHYDGEARFSLPAEHAVALTDETSAACVIGAYQVALAAAHSTDRLTDAFRTGAGIGWGEHDPDLYPGCERFFAPTYRNFLTAAWIPALDGIEQKLSTGARVADLGCGHGASTLLMAQAYPASTFVGVDAHQGSVDAARKRAAEAGLANRVQFVTGTAQDFTGTYDLVTFFDCLHDMGDPAAACGHVHDALNPDGALMIVEPRAGNAIEENLNPVSAVYYAASTLLCTPNALSQRRTAKDGEADDGAAEDGAGGRDALGAQAGEARIRAVVAGAGFGTFRRIGETPFNQVFEARP